MRLANRTGRVVAVGRLLLALFFLLASARSIDGPIAYPGAMLAISVGYLVWAGALLALTWRNWWLDHRLGLATHLTDFAIFVALNAATGLSVTSPFFIFFVFLVLSAAARWGWGAGMWTGAAATLLFVSGAAYEIFTHSLSSEEYLYAIVRGGHLVALSLMMSWFGMTHLAGNLARTRSFGEIEPGEAPVERALPWFADCMGGSWAGMVWTEPDEPWLHIACWSEECGLRTDRAGPEDFDWLIAPELEGQTFLFDVSRGRALYRQQRRFHTLTGKAAINPALARRAPIDSGICTPVESHAFTGHLFVGGMDGLAWEELPNARRCALDLARGFERWEAMRTSAETAESEARLRIARDLHDSVAQILAGIGLKLRAARTTAPDAAQRDRELQGIEEELVAYQRQIHGFIDELRHPRAAGSRVDLDARLNAIAATLRRQWSIEIDVSGDHLVSIPGLLADEVAHLLHEATANAVRHGGATKLSLSAEVAEDCLRLVIQDNGRGFAETGSFDHFALKQQSFGPRSILERVESVRGTVELVSGEIGAIVSITVPLGTLAS
jgi:signal transduction histidine kinase